MNDNDLSPIVRVTLSIFFTVAVIVEIAIAVFIVVATWCGLLEGCH
jgi:hypothetical protein